MLATKGIQTDGLTLPEIMVAVETIFLSEEEQVSLVQRLRG